MAAIKTTKEIKKCSNVGHFYVPKQWVGRKVEIDKENETITLLADDRVQNPSQ